MVDPELSLDSGQLSLLNKLYPQQGGTVAKTKKGSSSSKWDDVPEPGEDILVGGYDFKIADLKVGETGENAKTPGCKMYIAELVVEQPEEMKGTTHTEFFVVGNAEDPNGDDPATLRGLRSAQAFKAFCTAAGVAMSDDDEELTDELRGQTVFGNVDAPNKEGGRKSVKGNGWFPVGENDPEVREKPAKGKKAPAAKKAVKASAKKGRDADDEEDEEETERPAKKSKPAAKKVTKKRDEEEDEEDEDEEEERPAKKKSRRDEDEDEDDDSDEDDEEEEEEEEEERPKRGSRR